MENNGNDPFLEDCKSPAQPIWIPLNSLAPVSGNDPPYTLVNSQAHVHTRVHRNNSWYTVWVSIPSAQVESLLTTPAVPRCILLVRKVGFEPTLFGTQIGRMPRTRTEKLLVLSEEGIPIPFNIPIYLENLRRIISF